MTIMLGYLINGSEPKEWYSLLNYPTCCFTIEYDGFHLNKNVSLQYLPRALAENLSGGGPIRIEPVLTTKNGRTFEMWEV